MVRLRRENQFLMQKFIYSSPYFICTVKKRGGTKMKKQDYSLTDYSEVEQGKEFEYPESAEGIPIFEGSFISWGKPEEVIRDKKIASRDRISLWARLRCFIHRG